MTGEGDLNNLSAAVEVAAYRIVIEAITNVVRHAQATRCTVRMSLIPTRNRPTSLQIDVHDNGVGIGIDVPSGFGLASQRERAAELSGTWEVTCAPGNGTLLRAVLPIR